MITGLLLLAAVSGLHAQYQKVSFFSNKGRSVGIGSTAFVMGDGKGAPIGFYYEGSRERTGRQFFTFGSISVIPGYKFAFQTTGVTYDQTTQKTVTVSGKTGIHVLYAFNVGYFLLNQKGEPQKVKPFVSAGVNVLLAGRLKEVNYPDGYEVNKDVGGQSLNTGFRAGAGCIVDLSDRFSVKLDAGYAYQINIYPPGISSAATYGLFTSHVAAGLGIRYHIFTE